MSEECLFNVLEELDEIIIYCDAFKNICSPENYNIIQQTPTNKIHSMWCEIRNIALALHGKYNSHHKLYEQFSNQGSIVKQKIMILEVFHNYTNKQNRLNYINKTYGTMEEIFGQLNKIYEYNQNINGNPSQNINGNPSQNINGNPSQNINGNPSQNINGNPPKSITYERYNRKNINIEIE